MRNLLGLLVLMIIALRQPSKPTSYLGFCTGKAVSLPAGMRCFSTHRGKLALDIRVDHGKALGSPGIPVTEKGFSLDVAGPT